MDGNDTVTSSDSEQSNLNIKQNKNFFRIMEVNVNSLKGKKEEFKSVLNQHNPDCVVLVETKLDNTYNNTQILNFLTLINGILLLEKIAIYMVEE